MAEFGRENVLNSSCTFSSVVEDFLSIHSNIASTQNLEDLNQKIYYVGFLPVLSGVGCVLICCVLTAFEHSEIV